MLSPKTTTARPYFRMAISLALVWLAACSPSDGTRRPEVAYWEGANPPVRRFEGEKVFWKGEWVHDGLAKYFDQEGRVIGKGQFTLGLEEGRWTLEGEDGFLSEGNFRKGKRDGPWVYSFPSGKVQEEGDYAGGLRVGEWRKYYSDGLLKSVTQYQAGEIIGTPKAWDGEGNAL